MYNKRKFNFIIFILVNPMASLHSLQTVKENIMESSLTISSKAERIYIQHLDVRWKILVINNEGSIGKGEGYNSNKLHLFHWVSMAPKIRIG